MMTENVDTLIIGGGLSGIYTAWLLNQKKKSFVLLEARDRAGGRVLSPEHCEFFTDLGPSWYWPMINPRITRLVQTMGLEGYPQFEEGLGRFQAMNGMASTIAGYPTKPPSWRISGGMVTLVKRLCQDIPADSIRRNHPVCEIQRENTGVLVVVGELGQEPRSLFRASRVILALPPRLAASTILFTPDLSHELTQAMLKTGTWMAGQAKFFALYNKAFWRNAGLSGQAFSQCGPLGEVHDGSSSNGWPYGLTGFVSIPPAQRGNRERLVAAMLEQLSLLYGDGAKQPIAIFYKDWATERYTATEFDQRIMREHPLYQPPAGKTGIWDKAVLFAGTETADQYGGYLEGALASAERAVSISQM